MTKQSFQIDSQSAWRCCVSAIPELDKQAALMRTFARLARTAGFSTAATAPTRSPVRVAVAAGAVGGAAVVLLGYNRVVPHEWMLVPLGDPFMPVLRFFSPEKAHNIAVQTTARGFIPKVRVCVSSGRSLANSQIVCVGRQDRRTAAPSARVRHGLLQPDRRGCRFRQER